MRRIDLPAHVLPQVYLDALRGRDGAPLAAAADALVGQARHRPADPRHALGPGVGRGVAVYSVLAAKRPERRSGRRPLALVLGDDGADGFPVDVAEVVHGAYLGPHMEQKSALLK